MHHNHHFLKHLAQGLQQRLQGMELAACFSQNRDELVLGFCSPQGECWIKAVLHPALTALAFPDDFQRAKQNSIDLFNEALGKIVGQVWVFENERALGIGFSDGWALVFKMFGSRSNAVLYEQDVPVRLFRQQQAQDLSVPLQAYHRRLDQSFEAFGAKGLQGTFPTLGKELQAYAMRGPWERLDAGQRWEQVQALLRQLEQPRFYVDQPPEGLPKLWLVPPPSEAHCQAYSDPIEAANAFFYAYSKTFYLEKERGDALRALQHRIRSTWSYLEKTSAKLDELVHLSRYEEIGHLLMANLHQIPPHAEQALLHDFYRDAPIAVKLNPQLSPQKNAESYYRKAKNQKIEVAQLRENLARKEAQLAELEAHAAAVEGFGNLRELRKYLKSNSLDSDTEQQPVFPFRRFAYEGFEIWVGKNAKNNDLLTQQYAFKEDLWMHARDVPGSHVLLKYRAGKPFPSHVVEKAASLAAYYSPRKNDTLCPVIVTPKKFVRKPKGLPPGMVVVDKEEVVMVAPERFE